MTLNEIASLAIFLIFVLLLVTGAVSTGVRFMSYRRLDAKPPLLLGRDVALLVGLSIPFVLIAFVRAIGLTGAVAGDAGPELWWLLLTGIPPILALSVYCYFELWVIERPRD